MVFHYSSSSRLRHSPKGEPRGYVPSNYLLALKLYNILWFYGHMKNKNSYRIFKDAMQFFKNIFQVKKRETNINQRFLKVNYESIFLKI